jgi:hypothetical protein
VAFWLFNFFGQLLLSDVEAGKLKTELEGSAMRVGVERMNTSYCRHI